MFIFQAVLDSMIIIDVMSSVRLTLRQLFACLLILLIASISYLIVDYTEAELKYNS
jgi:hypothetical protein